MADLKISQLTAATTPLGGTEVLPIVQSGATVKATIADVQAAPIAALSANSVLFTNATKVPSTGVKLTYDGTLFNTGSAGATGTHLRVRAQGAMAQFDTGAAADGRIEYAYNSVNMAFLGINSATQFAVWGRTGTTVLIGAGNATRVEVQSGGDVVVSTGNLVIGTSGKGIDFSATAGTGTSELLADYEEGTWTPVLSSASGSFTTVTLGADTSAYYTKIGREVTFQMWFTTDAITVGTASGDVYISLPFTAATLAGAGDHSSGSVGLCINFTVNHPNGIVVRGGDNKMNLITRTTANGATSNLQVGSLATGAGSNIIVISGLYIAA